MLDPDPEPKCTTVPVLQRQKVKNWGSDSTTLHNSLMDPDLHLGSYGQHSTIRKTKLSAHYAVPFCGWADPILRGRWRSRCGSPRWSPPPSPPGSGTDSPGSYPSENLQYNVQSPFQGSKYAVDSFSYALNDSPPPPSHSLISFLVVHFLLFISLNI
jgi:hypothetical protein